MKRSFLLAVAFGLVASTSHAEIGGYRRILYTADQQLAIKALSERVLAARSKEVARPTIARASWSSRMMKKLRALVTVK